MARQSANQVKAIEMISLHQRENKNKIDGPEY